MIDGMKAFLLAKAERREIFDRYYESLKSTLDSDLQITPDDALILIAHHIFVMPALKKIMDWNLNDKVSVLLDKTVNELKWQRHPNEN